MGIKIVAWFPTGYSGINKIIVGGRSGDTPMNIVTGSMGNENIHFTAPPSSQVNEEMILFFQWWESSLSKVDGLHCAGIAHLYFVTIHPFEDGNGRLARALTDHALVQNGMKDS